VNKPPVRAVVAVREVGGAAPVEDYRLTRYGAGERVAGEDLVNSALTSVDRTPRFSCGVRGNRGAEDDDYRGRSS
jgi:hypothetical protein